MTTMEHRAMPMSRDGLAALLVQLAERVRSGDSAEGHLEYLLPTPEDDERSGGLPAPDMVMVQAGYRTGNRNGQGGFMMIGQLVETESVAVPTTEVPIADLIRLTYQLRDAVRRNQPPVASQVVAALGKMAGLPEYQGGEPS